MYVNPHKHKMEIVSSAKNMAMFRTQSGELVMNLYIKAI